MQTLSISFHNFYPPMSRFVLKALSERYNVTVERFGTDIEFYSVFGQEFPEQIMNSNALKVWMTGENRDPRHIVYDLHFGFQKNPLLGQRSFRFPLWILYIDWWNDNSIMSINRLLAPRHIDDRPYFCNFIYSKDMSFRAEFFQRMNERRNVDSLGRILNNQGGQVSSKMNALMKYRFTLAFENIRAHGYVTEKILEPLAAGSIPIYWGASEVQQDFNPDAFIDVMKFESVDAVIDHVLEISENRSALKALTEAPIFNGPVPYYHTPSFFVDQIEDALKDPSKRNVGRSINRQLAPYQSLKIRLKAWSRRLHGK
jgi:hypothetical protein